MVNLCLMSSNAPLKQSIAEKRSLSSTDIHRPSLQIIQAEQLFQNLPEIFLLQCVNLSFSHFLSFFDGKTRSQWPKLFGDQKQDPLVFWDGLTISSESQSPSEWSLKFSLFHAYIWREKKRIRC